MFDDFGGEYEEEEGSDVDEDDFYEEEIFEDYSAYPAAFGFHHHDSDDECSSARSSEEQFYSQSWEYFRSMTPPMRSENPMCSDDRFQYYSTTPTSVGSFRSGSNGVGVELGIFNFSPPCH